MVCASVDAGGLRDRQRAEVKRACVDSRVVQVVSEGAASKDEMCSNWHKAGHRRLDNWSSKEWNDAERVRRMMCVDRGMRETRGRGSEVRGGGLVNKSYSVIQGDFSMITETLRAQHILRSGNRREELVWPDIKGRSR